LRYKSIIEHLYKIIQNRIVPALRAFASATGNFLAQRKNYAPYAPYSFRNMISFSRRFVKPILRLQA